MGWQRFSIVGRVMAKRISKKITSTLNNSGIPGPAELSAIFPDLEDWPKSWRATDRDIPHGEQILDCFRPFLQFLALEYAKKTIRKHGDNLWMLGGEIIRDLNQTPRLRKVPIAKLLFDLVADGGPLLYHSDSEEQRRSFESTCNKFRRFLERSSP